MDAIMTMVNNARLMSIPKGEYDALVKDQQTLEVIMDYVTESDFLDRKTMKIILGIVNRDAEATTESEE